MLQEHEIKYHLEMILDENIFSGSVDAVKNLFKKVASNAGNKEGIKKNIKMLEPITRKISKDSINEKMYKLAEQKGISKKVVQKGEMQITRLLSLWNIVGISAMNIATMITPFILLIALIKAGGVDDFKKQTSEVVKEIGKSLRGTDSAFEGSVAIGKMGILLFIAGIFLIVPMIPAAFLLLASYVYFNIELLKMYGD